MILNIPRKQELEAKIADIEDSLSILKKQLSLREEDAHNKAINNLEFYLKEVDHKYENFRNFRIILVNEFQDWFKETSNNNIDPRTGRDL